LVYWCTVCRGGYKIQLKSVWRAGFSWFEPFIINLMNTSSNRAVQNIFRVLWVSLLMMSLAACSSAKSEPLSFNPELFTKKGSSGGECYLLVDNVSTSFPTPNPHDAMIRLSGTMTESCSNLQVGMEQPDMGKNIRIEVVAATSTAGGGSVRPFVVELSSKALRYGTYTVWVNGSASTIFSVE